MAEIRYPTVEQQQGEGRTGPKIRNVPIAVTPEGFWCCPSPVAFQKTIRAHQSQTTNKPKSRTSATAPPPPPPPKRSSSTHKKQPGEKKSTHHQNQSKSPTTTDSDDNKDLDNNNAGPTSSNPIHTERSHHRAAAKAETSPRKVLIEFGEPGTSDLKLVLLGKHGFSVKLNVHKDVLVENSSYFAKKLYRADEDGSCSPPPLPFVEIDDCEDVEIYVETIGLMYCKDMKLRLIKQSVQRVLRILKAAELIGFRSCIQSCLDYLEAVPWVGEEEEDKVVSSVLRLQRDGTTVDTILKRVDFSSASTPPPKDTLSQIIELVLNSTEERGRREIKSVVLKLLKGVGSANSSSNNNYVTTTSAAFSSSLGGSTTSSSFPQPDLCHEMIYTSCRTCLDSLLLKFKEATTSDPEFINQSAEVREPLIKQIALEVDNILWLVDILADRRVADEFVGMWAQQEELSSLHPKLHTIARHHVSCVSARLFVGIGKGEMLPSKETRHKLLNTWLEPLINDYNWLNHGCRSFDRTMVEEGIGRTILTLPLEDQQSTLLNWLGRFLRNGDGGCPDLRRAFEVWWRRAFIRPHGEQMRGGSQGRLDMLMALEGVD